MRSQRFLLVFVLAFGAAMPGSRAGEPGKVSLRWKLSEGDQLRLKVTQATKTETSVKGKASAVSIDTGLEMLWKVDRVERDGTMRMLQSFDRVMMKTSDIDGRAIVYDSSSKEEPPPDLRNMARDIRPLLGSRFVVAMSNRGEILEVTQPEKPGSKAADEPGGSRWKGLLTKDGINQTLRQTLGQLPEDPVAKGDKWSSSYEVDSPLGRIRIVNDYTHGGTVSRDGKAFAKITMVSRVEPQKAPHARGEPAIPVPEEYGGTFYFDNIAGRLVHSEITQTMTSEVPYQDTAIKVHARSTIVLSVTSLKGG